MASYTVAVNERGVYEKTLAANTEDIVTINAALHGTVEIKVLSGASPVYVTVNNSAATVKGAHCYDVQPGTAAQIKNLSLSHPTYPAVVRLISAATAVYSVSALTTNTLT